MYTVKEHLVLRSPESDLGTRAKLRSRLLALSLSLMPRGNVRSCQLVLRAGKALHSFAGRLPTPELYALIQALGQGDDLEFIGFYQYNWEPWWEKSREADPFLLAGSFLTLGRTPIRDLFYSLYVGDGRDPGEVIAYGEKDGRHYLGVVPYVSVPRLPDRGQWLAPVEAVRYQAGNLKNVDLSRLVPVCRSLCALGGEKELKVTLLGFRFTLRNPEFRRSGDLLAYAALCRELQEITGGESRIWDEFVDLSGPDPRMVLLDCRTASAPRMSLL